jgi:hypothetical protein
MRMRRQGELSGKERRQFEGLVRAFHELDAYDPHAPDVAARPDLSPASPAVGVSSPGGLRARWRRWRAR